jgi:hypothetical protein
MSFTITSGLGFTPSTKLVFTSPATASTTAWEAGASYVARRTSGGEHLPKLIEHQ